MRAEEERERAAEDKQARARRETAIEAEGQAWELCARSCVERERERAAEDERVCARQETTVEADERARELLIFLVAARMKVGRRSGGQLLLIVTARMEVDQAGT